MRPQCGKMKKLLSPKKTFRQINSLVKLNVLSRNFTFIHNFLQLDLTFTFILQTVQPTLTNFQELRFHKIFMRLSFALLINTWMAILREINFWQIQGFKIWHFDDYITALKFDFGKFHSWKLQKFLKIKLLEQSKWQFLTFSVNQNRFHVKSEWQRTS